MWADIGTILIPKGLDSVVNFIRICTTVETAIETALKQHYIIIIIML